MKGNNSWPKNEKILWLIEPKYPGSSLEMMSPVEVQ